MDKKIRLAVTGLAIITLGFMINMVFYKPFSVNFFFERLFISYLWKDPELLSNLGLLDKYGIKIHHDKLTDLSDKYINEDLRYTVKELEILGSYNLKNVSDKNRFSAKILESFLEERIYSDEFIKYEYVFSHLMGPHINMPLFFSNVHEIKSIKDTESYLKRLYAVKYKIEQTINIIELGEQYNNLPPKLILERVKNQLLKFINSDIVDNILYQDFTTKLKNVPELNSHIYQEMLYEIKITISNIVIPAYQLLIDKIDLILDISPSELGMWTYDQDNFYYTYILKKYVTEDVLPENIFQIANQKLEKYLEEVKAATQYFIAEKKINSNDTLGRLLHQIIYNKKNLYKPSENQQFIQDFQANIDKIFNKFPYFTETYKLKIPVLEPCIDLLKEDLVDFMYYPGSLYNNRNSKLYYSPLSIPKSKVLTPFWVYQWIIPGLHLQKNIQNQQVTLPTFRRHIEFTYYHLGWKLYSLDLANKFNLYEKTPVNQVAFLHEFCLNYALAIIDIGMHCYRWDYDKCMDFLLSNTGLTLELAHLQILNIAMTPAQSVSLLIGYNYFKRTEKQIRLKRDIGFDLITYMEEILELGPINTEIFYELENYFE